MKKIAFFTAIALFTTLACDKIDSVSEGHDCTVSLNLIGEITTSEEPLSRVEGGSNDLYAVQVYQGSNVFAWGIFDHMSDIRVNLKQGSTYLVKVAKVTDAKTLLGTYYSLTNDGVRCFFIDDAGPFWVTRVSGNSNYNLSSSYYMRTNVFFYKSRNYLEYFNSSSTTSLSTYNFGNNYFSFGNISRGSLQSTKYPFCNDWFYGEASNFTPNGETMTWEIPLKRVGFKLKYEISGVTDGAVTVTISNGTRTFFQSTTTTPTYESETKFIAFYDAASAWQYADNYMENMTVSVSWARGIGVTQDLGSKVVSVKRNCLNNIKITLGNDDRSAGVSLNTESDLSMGSSENTVIVQ